MLRKYILALLRKSSLYRKWHMIPRGQVTLNEMPPGTVKSVQRGPVVRREPPLSIDAKLYWKFAVLLQENPEPTFVAEGYKWRVWGNQGAVITDKGDLFSDVSREFEKPEHSIFKQFRLRASMHLPGTSAVLAASGSDMYYHWLFDILPRIQLLKESGYDDKQIDHYIVDYRDVPFQQESLAAAGIPFAKVSRSNDHFAYQIEADHLLVPSLPSRLDIVSPKACNYIRDILFDAETKSSFGKKIYLKRTAKRAIVNANEIENELINWGFDTVACEKFSIKEQAAIFHGADIVIGPHGAAFSNVVFCKPGTKIVEFFSPNWINPCYWTICNHLKAPYYYLIGEGAPPNQRSDAKWANDDILLSLEKLRRLFSEFQLLD